MNYLPNMFPKMYCTRTHTINEDTSGNFPHFLCLLEQWEALKFSAPVLRVLESCAFRPGLVGPHRAQCVLLTQAPAVLRHPAWLWRVAKLWGGVGVWTEGGPVYHRTPPNIPPPLPPTHSWQATRSINHFLGLVDYKAMVEKMLLWIIRLIAINSVKWCAKDWGSCFSTLYFSKG